MRISILTYIFGIFILLLSFELNAQTNEMEMNDNRICKDFIASSEFKVKINGQSKTENEINLIIEKTEGNRYSIYILNKTNDSITISKQDWSLYLIQEAKDKNGNWKPIEYWQYATCGNSYLSNKLEPNGVLKTESIAYNGNFETEIRFKFLNGKKIYYSSSVTGKINENQFNLPNDIKTKWPVRIIAKTISDQTIRDVIFLDPNGTEKLMAELEKLTQKN